MKNAFQLFLNSVVYTLKQGKDPKIAIYLIPGAIFGLIFWDIYFVLYQVENVIRVIENIPLIGKVLSWILIAPIDLIQFILIQVLTFIVLTLLSPVNTFLSERIEFQLTGKKFPFSISIILRDVWRMLRVVTYLLLLEFFFLFMYWLVLGWYNPINWFDDLVFFCIAAFFYGISFFDYSFERHGLGLSKTMRYAKSNLWLMLFSGGFFLVIFSIPVAGIIIAPVILTISTTFSFVTNSSSKFDK
jgi:CysZ protein